MTAVRRAGGDTAVFPGLGKRRLGRDPREAPGANSEIGACESVWRTFCGLRLRGSCAKSLLHLPGSSITGLVWAPFCGFDHCVSAAHQSTKQTLCGGNVMQVVLNGRRESPSTTLLREYHAGFNKTPGLVLVCCDQLQKVSWPAPLRTAFSVLTPTSLMRPRSEPAGVFYWV